MALVFKIADAADWRRAEADGAFGGAPVDLRDGFIHLSTAAQVAETAARHFAGTAGLVLAAFEAEALGDGLRFEPSRGGDLFPHLYGPLPAAAARWVEPLPLSPAGVHVLPDLVSGAPAAGRFDPAGEGWTRHDGVEFMGLVGPIWSREDDGRPLFGFLAEPRHLNRGGVVHGGMLMTFVDQTLGMVGWRATNRQAQLTIQLDTHFISSAKAGEFVVARGRVVRRTRSLLFLACELSVGERLVATSSGVWKLRTGAPVSDGR